MSFEIKMEYEQSDEFGLDTEKLEKIRQVSEKLGLRPAPEKANRQYGPDGSGLRIEPVIPQGWHYVPSSDGVGVLAPQAAFREGTIEPLDLYPYSPDAATLFIQKADRAFEDGFPATALFYLHELYWYHWTDDAVRVEAVPRLMQPYHARGRPSLARLVEWREMEIKRLKERFSAKRQRKG